MSCGHMQGPVVALVLAKGENTISDWQQLMGPEDVKKAQASDPNSIRAKYGIVEHTEEHDSMMPDLAIQQGSIKLMNAVHGSETPQAAQREIRFFFPSSKCWSSWPCS